LSLASALGGADDDESGERDDEDCGYQVGAQAN
jgi:hypothetical protein